MFLDKFRTSKVTELPEIPTHEIKYMMQFKIIMPSGASIAYTVPATKKSKLLENPSFRAFWKWYFEKESPSFALYFRDGVKTFRRVDVASIEIKRIVDND